MIVHNVVDGRHCWIGSWEVEPSHIKTHKLTEADKGRTVIYLDHGRAEAGTLTGWRNDLVFARYSQGDTAAAAEASRVYFAVRTLDGDPDRVRKEL